jgi:2-alkyl-3-oxoalkanoate reductase
MAVPFLVVFLADHPRPTRRQGSGGDRHLKFYEPRDNLGPGGEWATGVKSGDVPIVGEGAGQYPFVHVRDAVSATVQAVDRGSPGIYNVVGDEPASQAEWLPYLAEILEAPPPRRVSEEEAEEQLGAQAVYYGTQLRAASNAKAKSELGLTLEYPSWREGFRALFG